MNGAPTPEEVREKIAPLDDLDRKVLGGMVAVWMAEPAKLRDREWTAQQFVHVATVAHGFDAEQDLGPGQGAATSEDVERVRSYAQRRMDDLLLVGLALFVRVATDMQAREGGFNYEDAQECVRGYLGAGA
jgi:hypothetical protein